MSLVGWVRLDTRSWFKGVVFSHLARIAGIHNGCNVSIHAGPIIALKGSFLGFVVPIMSGEEVPMNPREYFCD